MKKYFSLILVVLICCTIFLSGCNLTSIDSAGYNSKIVAKYGTMEINRRELNLAYNANGSNYVNEGKTAEEAVEKVVNDIINRKLLIDYSKETYGVISISESEYNKLSEAEKATFTKGPYNFYVNNLKFYDFNSVMTSIYDYINKEVLTFENEIRLQKGLNKVNSEETKTDTDSESGFKGYNKYESSINYIGGKFVKKVEEHTSTSVLGEYVLDVYGSEAISNEALHRYLIKVRNSNIELYKNKNKYSDILKTHILDLFDTYEGNRYTQIVQEEFTKTLPLEEDAILKYYKTKVTESYTKYNMPDEGYGNFVADMQSDHSKAYWNYTGSKGFVLTAHVLIKFDDATVLKLKNLETDKENGLDEATYNLKRNEILNSVGTYERNIETGDYVYKTDAEGNFVFDKDGNRVKKFYTYLEIYEMIENELSTFNSIQDNNVRAQKKAEAFNKYIYMFGMDEGSINASHYYACNLDTGVEDKLVKNYANTTRELYKNKGIGSLSAPVLVEADNYSGYHIILLVDEAKNLVSINNLNNVTLEALYGQKPMLGVNKTMLDVVYDSITKDSYDNHHNELVERLRNEFAGDAEINLYPYNYKSLLEK